MDDSAVRDPQTRRADGPPPDTGDGRGLGPIGTVIEHSAWRSRRAWQLVSALVAVLMVVVVVLVLVVVSQGHTISALTDKSAEQTTAEVQLRHTNASQQTTIAGLATSLHKAHQTTLRAIAGDTAPLTAATRQLLGYDEALSIVVIDAIDGAPRRVLLRDLQALARLLPPLP